eukprot:scaffold776_cov347-Pavlova_lutheri.AAC.152
MHTKQYTSVKPAGDRVFVKLGVEEEVSTGGILLPNTAQKKPSEGSVVAVAAEDATVKIGDQVVYSKYAGTEIELGGEDHVLLKEEDVVGIKGGSSYKDLKPLGDRVLIKVSKAEEATSGGVLLTDSAREKPLTGEVIAVGPGKKGEENTPTITPGSTVMYQKYAGTEFKDKDGSEYIVVQGSDVMATLS